MKAQRKLKQLAWREYLPLAATIAMWAVIVLAIGHAHAARLLAAVTIIRGVQLLTRLATTTALRRRLKASLPVRHQAKRFAFTIQAAALVIALLLVAGLVEAMHGIEQEEVAAFLPYIALGLPARYLRLADVRTASPYFRLALGVGGLATAVLAWAGSWPFTLFGLAFGAREWLAYAALRWWPRKPEPAKVLIDGPLHFAEVAQNSAMLARRLLTYRLTKSLLTVFGPFGNVAARTGRGLNWHRRVEPYLPHHLGGFVGFSLVTMAAAAVLAWRSGEPAAMIVAAGLFQIGSAAANVALLWRYLPPKGSEPLHEDEDDE